MRCFEITQGALEYLVGFRAGGIVATTLINILCNICKFGGADLQIAHFINILEVLRCIIVALPILHHLFPNSDFLFRATVVLVFSIWITLLLLVNLALNTRFLHVFG